MIHILGYLSDNGFRDLNDTQFKSEGRFASANGKSVMVYAAKSYQLRIYGFFQDTKIRNFVCPEAAIKKTNKADQSQLKRVAKKAGE